MQAHQMFRTISLSYLYRDVCERHHPARENDDYIKDAYFFMMYDKLYEEFRHKVALNLVKKGIYKNIIEPKIPKRDKMIRDSKYQYKHLIYHS